MALKRCSLFVGRRRVIQTPPSSRLARDVVFVPLVGSKLGGLFEPSGRAVPESIQYAGVPHLHTTQSTVSIEDIPSAHPIRGGEHHHFIGELHPHYGHFLVGAFARLWALPQEMRQECYLVFSSTITVDELLRLEFIREILTALGLSAANLLRITEPTRFDQITVPASTFEELSLIHQDFIGLMNQVGRAMAGRAAAAPRRRLVYLSKERLDRGVVQVSNEAALTASLRDLGVDIVFPEQLPLRTQIALWAEDPVMMGFSGSAFHTSGFLPARTLIVLAHGEEMWCNQVLIDMANRNNSHYLHEDTGLIRHGATATFHAVFEIRDPVALAADLVGWGRRVQARPRFGTPHAA